MNGMKVAVVAEYYPHSQDPSQGVWAHRQALAARDAGADVRVIVLHRPIPPLAALRRPAMLPGWLRREAGQSSRTTLDGIDVTYVRFLAPPRPLSYHAWGWWAAPRLSRALSALRRGWPFEVIHAHYAVPGAAAAAPFAQEHRLPLVVSVHGGDVIDTARRSDRAKRAVAEALGNASVVISNSAGTRRAVAELGIPEERLRVVRLGASVATEQPATRAAPTVCTVGYLVPRKRHADVLRGVAILREQLPDLRYLMIGDGPERAALERLAVELGIGDAVEFAGQLDPAEALRRLASCDVMAMPSEDEAFGVAYVEAMAAGVPAIGAAGEPGPEEIASLGEGLVRVPPLDPDALAEAIRRALEPSVHARLSQAARATASRHFSWKACGDATVAVYREALEGG